MDDAGYNQAMHEAVMAVKQNISCVSVIEAENVPDEAGATSTMENMIQQGAKLIIATAFNMQYPALDLAAKYPDVKFEHAGGWEMSDNFANFFGEPPEGWYMMGVAAAKMTQTNKLGFVAAFPLGWTSTFINAFELGAQSVNPDVETIVAYTFAWGDRAKEADTTNALINQGVDVITMHVDSPSTVISTANCAACTRLATRTWPLSSLLLNTGSAELDLRWAINSLGSSQPWLTGPGHQSSCVVDLRMGAWLLAPFGPKVPQEVQDLVMQTKADIESGNIVVFQGPVVTRMAMKRSRQAKCLVRTIWVPWIGSSRVSLVAK